MPELIATINAMGKVERRKQKFMAAIQGIDIDKTEEPSTEGSSLPTVEEIQARAIRRLTGDENLAGSIEQGISPEMGLNYSVSKGGVEIG